MKGSKQSYYTKYFESSWNNIRNTWKGMKATISIRNVTTASPHSIEFNSRTITDPTAMSNVFNNYFTSIAEKTISLFGENKILNYPHSHFTPQMTPLDIPTSVLWLDMPNYIQLKILVEVFSFVQDINE